MTSAKSTYSKTPQALALSRYLPNPWFLLLACQNCSWCHLTDGRRPNGECRASHGRVDSIENAEALKIRHSTDRDRIGEILDLSLRVGERRPRGKARAVWIARLREVDPVVGHLAGQFPISRSPVPGRLVQVVEDVPELGVVARTPTCVHGAGRKRRLLLKRVVKDRSHPGSGLQPRPGPHVPAEAEVALEAELRLPRLFVGRVGICCDQRRGKLANAALQVA